MKTDRKNWPPVRLISGQNHCIMQPTLTDRDRDIVQDWIRTQGLGEHLTDVEPLQPSQAGRVGNLELRT